MIQNIHCGYSLESPRRLTCTRNVCFFVKMFKKSKFYQWKFQFWLLKKISIYIARACFRNGLKLASIYLNNEENTVQPVLSKGQGKH